MSAPTRRAVVTGGFRTISEVEAYMPDNYRVIDRGADMAPLIEGEDVAGWTLTDYVLPRLASGLIFAEEIFPKPRASRLSGHEPGIVRAESDTEPNQFPDESRRAYS